MSSRLDTSTDATGDADDKPPLPVRAYRTVTPPVRGRSDTEMNAIGYLLFAILLVLLLPLGVFVLALWLVTALFDRLFPRED